MFDFVLLDIHEDTAQFFVGTAFNRPNSSSSLLALLYALDLHTVASLFYRGGSTWAESMLLLGTDFMNMP